MPYVLQVIHSVRPPTMPLSRRKKPFRPFQNWLQNAAELTGWKEHCGNLGRKGGVRATACHVSLDQQVCESCYFQVLQSTWRPFTACARFGDILFRPFLKRCTSSSYELHKSYSDSLVLVPKFHCTGISSQLSTKLHD